MKKFSNEIIEKIKIIWKNSRFDPTGSYIGNSKLDGEPQQDQDDL